MPLDFSANVSPLGLPEGVRRAVTEALKTAHLYPDPLCRELRRALSRRHGVGEEQVLCGNGAADLIFRLALAAGPGAGVVTAPTFAEYEQALRAAGRRAERALLREAEGFAVTEGFLSHIRPGVGLVFLCEPNNPTGRTTDRALLQKILEKCAACGALLIADECFNEFLDEPEAHSLIGELSRFENLLILRAFTKWYGMAGLRLGYCLGSPALLKKMAQCGQPWGVSSLAQAAGVQALKEEAYSRRLKALIKEQRPILAEGLQGHSCRVLPGEANYLLFFCEDAKLAEKLREKGILLRDCANYPGLSPGWFRCAVRGGEENRALLRAMREVL